MILSCQYYYIFTQTLATSVCGVASESINYDWPMSAYTVNNV